MVGHTTKKDKGAFSPYLLQSEQPYNTQVAANLKTLAPGLYDVYMHDIQDYYKRQQRMAARLNAGKYSLAIELHFNAAATATANGTECLHWYGSKKGKLIARDLSEEIVAVYGTTLRGVQGTRALANVHDRGYWFTALTNVPAVIVEPFFGSHQESLMFNDVHEYACVLHNYLKQYQGA